MPLCRHLGRAVVAAAALLACTAAALPHCFLSMGDWGYNDPHVLSMAQYMDRAVAHPATYGCSNVTLTLALGDNFYNSGVDSAYDPKWQRIWVNQFRVQPAFGNMTVLPTMGDHDYAQLNPHEAPNFTRAQAQIDYHYLVDPQWYLPDANYSYVKDFGGIRVFFLMINTEALYACIHLKPEWCFQPDHADWIDAQLAQADNDPSIAAIVIGGHHAVVCPLGGHYDPKLDAVLVPIARRHRVSLILTGHSHFVAWSREGDVTGGGFDAGDLWYIVNGAGRGAGPYHCWWNGLRMPVAQPMDELCSTFALSTAGAFMIHRVHPTGLEHCIVDSMNGTVVKCQQTAYRAPGGTAAPTSPATPQPEVPPTPVPPPTSEQPATPAPSVTPGPPGGVCPKCAAAVCAASRCPRQDLPYTCTAGPAKGGCRSGPWRIDSACTACCDLQLC